MQKNGLYCANWYRKIIVYETRFLQILNISEMIKPIPGCSKLNPEADPNAAVEWGVQKLRLILEGHAGSTQKAYAH